MITLLQIIDPEKLGKKWWYLEWMYESFREGETKYILFVHWELVRIKEGGMRWQKDGINGEFVGKKTQFSGHLGSGVETYCSVNSLESMKVIFLRMPINGGLPGMASSGGRELHLIEFLAKESHRIPN